MSYISHGNKEEEFEEEELLSDTEKKESLKASSSLEAFTLNLNEEAKYRRIDPLIGLKGEVELSLIQI